MPTPLRKGATAFSSTLTPAQAVKYITEPLSDWLGAWEQSETRAETAPLQRDPIANAFEGDRMGVRQQMPACLEPVSRFGITHPITTQAPISVIASFCMETEGF